MSLLKRIGWPTLLAAALGFSAAADAHGYYYGGGGYYGHPHGYYRGGYYGGYGGGVYFGPSFGFSLGVPLYPPYYAYPPTTVIQAAPAAPPVYIEQGNAGQPGQSNYWYYCAESRAYYPYVKDCPGGWQQVAPQPPPPQ